nr:MAG TPA: hypothetical protein [Caudoviricetes sp.]
MGKALAGKRTEQGRQKVTIRSQVFYRSAGVFYLSREKR